MNAKKVNWAFLISIILYIALSYGLVYLAPNLANSIVASNFLVEMVVLLPGILVILLSKEKLTEFLHFHRIKIGTFFGIILFTICTTPVITLFNLLTQFFVENTATSMMSDYGIAEMPFLLIWFTIGLFAPFCEEVACRGVYYRGYRKSGSAFWAMLLSALLFGLVHMNLNQAVYAFAMGILAVLLVEATGSIWSSVLYHAFINSSQVTLMYLALKMDPSVYDDAAEIATTDFLVMGVAAYLALAAVGLPLAWALLIWMSEREGRRGVLLSVWTERKQKVESEVTEDGKRKKKNRLVTIPLVIGLLLCVTMMVLPVFIN